MDRLDRDFSLELRRVISRVNDRIGEKNQQLDEEIPKAMEIPRGDVYAVFKRSNKGHNHRLLMNLPRTEAIFWGTVFNQHEIEKRKQMSTVPEEVWFFDCVREGTNEEDIYWNPNEIIS